MATTTVYASSTDGDIQSSNATYLTARSGGTLTAGTSGTFFFVGQNLKAGNYSCYEAFLNYDLVGGGIPAGTVATAASLTFGLFSDGSVTDFVVEARTHDWGSSLTTADWVAGSSLSGKTLLASLSTSGIANPFTLTNSGTALLDAVNTALAGDGILRVLLCSDRHGAGTAPTGSELLQVYSTDQTGTTNDPKIDVTYPDAGHPAMRRFGLSRPAVPRIHGMEGAYIF